MTRFEERMGTRVEERAARFELNSILDLWEAQMRLLTDIGFGAGALIAAGTLQF